MARAGRNAKKPTDGQAPNQAVEPETVAGYFRKVFKEHPRLLKERSNEELPRHWLADHPGHDDVPKQVKVGLQNIKGILRRKRRRKQAVRQALPELPRPDAAAPEVASGPTGLEVLDAQIDDCLMFARNLDADGLSRVITLLRAARNKVVGKLGQSRPFAPIGSFQGFLDPLTRRCFEPECGSELAEQPACFPTPARRGRNRTGCCIRADEVVVGTSGTMQASEGSR